MASDADVVQAARTSYGKGTKTVSDDRNLIRYLMRNWHTTPFEMCFFLRPLPDGLLAAVGATPHGVDQRILDPLQRSDRQRSDRAWRMAAAIGRQQARFGRVRDHGNDSFQGFVLAIAAAVHDGLED